MPTRIRTSAWLLAIATLFSTGCGGDVPERIEWDLSESHQAADVDFEPNGDVDGTVLEGVESVRIELPEGRVFEADSDIHDVTLGTEGDSLVLVAVEFQPESVDDAYERAQSLAGLWDMPTENLEQWYRKASRSDDDLTTTGLTHSGDFLGGPDGPQPTVEVRPFTEAAPALVSFQLHWNP